MKKLFLIIESQLIINMEESMVVKKSPFGHDQNNNSEKKNDVISYVYIWGEEWDYYVVSKYPPTK